MEKCECINYVIKDEEIVTGCISDCVITFAEVCPDCGSVTYGYEISDRDGELIDSDGGFKTREEAEINARNADRDPYE